MQQYAAFHQSLHCLLRLKQLTIQGHMENSTCDPLKYTMDSPVLFVSICMGKSIKVQSVNPLLHTSTFGRLRNVRILKIL